MIENINEKINNLREYYEENEYCNTLEEISIKDLTYILEKKELLDILKIIFKLENQGDLTNTIIGKLERKASSSKEMSDIIEIKRNIKDYKLGEFYNAKEVMSNKIIQKMRTDIEKIKIQYNNFDTFKDNQNKFDNMISIMKIIRRLGYEHIYINQNDFNFTTEEDNSTTLRDNIEEQTFKRFETIRFLI